MSEPQKIVLDDKLALLVGKYLDETISVEEAVTLREWIQKDRSVLTLLAWCSFADLRLNAMYDDRVVTDNSFGNLAQNEEDKREENPLKSDAVDSELAANTEIEVKSIDLMTPEELSTLFSSARKKNHQNEPDNTFDPFAILRKEEETTSVRTIPVKVKQRWKWNDYFFALCSLILVVLIGPVLWEDSTPDSKIIETTTITANDSELIDYAGLATLEETIDAVWKNSDSGPLKRGQRLGKERLILEQGLAKIRFKSEAELIMEGPSELLIQSDNSVFCTGGKLSAYVPPKAVGFEIMTPFTQVIDRGTKFFLHVGPETAEVDVLRGKVETVDKSGTGLLLTTGDSIDVNENGTSQKVATRRSRYYDSEQFSNQLKDYVTRLTTAREEADLALDTDPALLARFDFTNPGEETVRNHSTAGTDLVPSATLFAVEKTDGYLQGKNAIRVTSRKSRAEIQVQETWESLTLMATVRLDNLRGNGSVLFASERYYEQTGAILWQVLGTGEIQLLIRGKNNKTEYCISPPVLNPKQLGTWSQLTAVLNHGSKRISLYLDGVRLTSITWKDPQPIFLGQASIGNIPQDDQRDHLRNRFWTGAIDEFSIYTQPKNPVNRL